MRGPVAGMGMGMGVASSRAIRMSPYALFTAGEQGLWFDPSDIRTLFQDTAGTIPVTAVGQSVARINDKSGRGNHATQATAGSRPILRQDASGRNYLEFDGVDDFLSTASINLSSSDKVTVLAGMRKQSDAAIQILTEFSASTGANAGSFYFTTPETVINQDFGFKSRGSTNTNGPARTAAGAFPAPLSVVLTGLGDISGSRSILRLNGIERSNITDAQGTGNLGSYPLYIGMRAGSSLAFNGRIYGIIIRATATDSVTLATMEMWLNSKTGAY